MMTVYLFLLTLHNLNRWLVLLAGVWALAAGVVGLGGHRTFRRGPVAAFMGTLHLQVVLGLLLYAFLGSQQIPVFPNAPRPSFQWEHLGLGLLAAAFATLGSVLSRRAEGDRAQYRAALLWDALALLTVLLAIPWWRPLLRLFSA